jgi:cell division protein FtsI (penicillin-binding protein 3)
MCSLYIIQIKQRDFFTTLAKQQYQITQTQFPERGLILDRTGKELTLNKDSLSAFIVPTNIINIEALEQFLKKNFPSALERLYQHPDSHFLYIKRKLTPEQQKLIEQSSICDIKFLKEPSRLYPYESLSHIIGITDIDNKGLSGIEMMYNDHLAGMPSTMSLEKDARSGHFYFNKEIKNQGSPGEPITLTIDADLQFLVHEELKETVAEYQAKEGAVLIMDPTTGELLVMAQYPTVDPHATENINLEYTKNKCVTDSHELGSVMKAFTALAALEEGVVKPGELIDCQNTKIGYINGFKISTWKAHDIIPFSDVIKYSNNFGIATVGLRLGSKLYDHYKALGFGTKTTLNWPGEQSGFVNPPSNWSKQSIISLSFGYEISATLLQLARAYGVIAMGYLVDPIIIKNNSGNNQTTKKLLYNEHTLNTMRTILEKNSINGCRIMGKTGTANLVIDGVYNKDRNTYTFAGIIQKGSYNRIVITFIKEIQRKGLYATSVAQPLFERIAHLLLIHDKIVS